MSYTQLLFERSLDLIRRPVDVQALEEFFSNSYSKRLFINGCFFENKGALIHFIDTHGVDLDGYITRAIDDKALERLLFVFRHAHRRDGDYFNGLFSRALRTSSYRIALYFTDKVSKSLLLLSSKYRLLELMRYALVRENYVALKALLEEGITPNCLPGADHRISFLGHAYANGDLEAITILLDAGAYLSAYDRRVEPIYFDRFSNTAQQRISEHCQQISNRYTELHDALSTFKSYSKVRQFVNDRHYQYPFLLHYFNRQPLDFSCEHFEPLYDYLKRTKPQTYDLIIPRSKIDKMEKYLQDKRGAYLLSKRFDLTLEDTWSHILSFVHPQYNHAAQIRRAQSLSKKFLEP